MGQLNDQNSLASRLQVPTDGDQPAADSSTGSGDLPSAPGGTLPDRITGHNPLGSPGSDGSKGP